MATRMTPFGVVVKSSTTRTAMNPGGFVIKHVEPVVGGAVKHTDIYYKTLLSGVTI